MGCGPSRTIEFLVAGGCGPGDPFEFVVEVVVPDCCIGPDVNTVGGIIGGHGDLTTTDIGNGNVPFKPSSGLPAGLFWPAPETYIVTGPAVYIATAQGQGGIKELYWGRRDPDGTLTARTDTSCVTTVLPGSDVGSYLNTTTVTPVTKGQTMFMNMDVAGPNQAELGGWAAEVRGSRVQPMGGNPNVNIAAGATVYHMICHGGSLPTTEAQAAVVLPVNCTAANLCVKTTATQPSSGDLVITLRKNGSGTPLTITVPASGAAGWYADYDNTVDFEEGDWCTVEIVNNATGTTSAMNNAAITLGFTPDEPYTGFIVFPNPSLGTFSDNDTRYITPYAKALSGAFRWPFTDEADARGPIPRDAVLDNMYAFMQTADAGDTTGLTVMVEGVASALAVSAGAGVTGVIAGTGSAELTELDGFSLRVVTGTGGTSVRLPSVSVRVN